MVISWCKNKINTSLPVEKIEDKHFSPVFGIACVLSIEKIEH
jgi:hypothetical protein